jgi:hypothetical protein
MTVQNNVVARILSSSVAAGGEPRSVTYFAVRWARGRRASSRCTAFGKTETLCCVQLGTQPWTFQPR